MFWLNSNTSFPCLYLYFVVGLGSSQNCCTCPTSCNQYMHVYMDWWRHYTQAYWCNRLIIVPTVEQILEILYSDVLSFLLDCTNKYGTFSTWNPKFKVVELWSYDLHICRATFLVAEACLVAGAKKNAYHTKYRDIIYAHDFSCETLRKGVFIAGAVFVVATMILNVYFYMYFTKATTQAGQKTKRANSTVGMTGFA